MKSSLFDKVAAEDRSRATMWDVPRFAEYHHCKLIAVENVVEAHNWVQFPAWVLAMQPARLRGPAGVHELHDRPTNPQAVARPDRCRST